jgi:hypothetical protein
MMLPIDPHADPSRRAWVAFPPCRHGDGCPDCESGRNCFVHWQYLIRNEGPRVFLQGPTYARTGGSRIRHKVTGAPPLRQCCTGTSLTMLTLALLFLVGLATAVGTHVLQLRLERWHYDSYFGD